MLIIVGRLTVLTQYRNSSRTVVFHKSGDHDLAWRTGQIALEPAIEGEEEDVQLIFEARSGQLGSEVAIDDIQPNYEPCDFSC